VADQTAGGRRPNVHFPPIANGLDYLDSVVEHLSGEPTIRDLKYAVLHLQSATEVLLKARLQQEHWSLVFKDPGRADRGRFESGDFESCTTSEALSRLRGIAGIHMSEGDAKEIDRLAKWRNALQHYGLTAPALAVESRAAQVLDILLKFLTDELLAELDEAGDADYRVTHIRHIHYRLGRIHAFVKTRMDRLRADLEPLADSTVTCPECDQPTVPLRPSPPACRCCEVVWDTAEELAERYAHSVLGEPNFSIHADGVIPPVRQCPACGVDALVLRACTAAAPEQPVPLCFGCCREFPRLVECEGACGNPVIPVADGGRSMCLECCSNAAEPL